MAAHCPRRKAIATRERSTHKFGKHYKARIRTGMALSISQAWEESRSILARDGKLFAIVALALVGLPSLISGLLSPDGSAPGSSTAALDLIVLIASIAALAGQLALMRLALGPSITVGGAIAHGIKRMPIYFVSALIIVAVLFVVAVIAAAILIALGVPIDAETVPMSPPVVTALIVLMAFVFFAAVRMLMGGPVATAEHRGPIGILRRSWALTSGHSWQLLGFLLMFFVGAVVVLMTVQTVAGIVARLLLGAIEPMSLSALFVALFAAVTNAVVTGLFAVMLARIYAQLVGRDASVSVPTTGI